MSHYCVIVIGEDYEEQLAPFDENLEVEKYWKDDYINLEEIKKLHPELKTDQDIVDYYSDGCEQYRIENGVLQYESTYSPNSQWDWYSVGGRWTGYFKLKSNPVNECSLGVSGVFGNKPEKGHVDVACVKDIDFEGMRKTAEDKANEYYNKVLKACGGVIPKLERTWGSVLKDETLGDIQSRRDFYHKQEANVKFNKDTGELGHFTNIDDFQCTKEDYVKVAGDKAGVPFAVVKDGEWYEKGKMGWFGSVSDEKDEDLWIDEFHKLMKDLPEDTLLTLIDCHI